MADITDEEGSTILLADVEEEPRVCEESKTGGSTASCKIRHDKSTRIQMNQSFVQDFRYLVSCCHNL